MKDCVHSQTGMGNSNKVRLEKMYSLVLSLYGQLASRRTFYYMLMGVHEILGRGRNYNILINLLPLLKDCLPH